MPDGGQSPDKGLKISRRDFLKSWWVWPAAAFTLWGIGGKIYNSIQGATEQTRIDFHDRNLSLKQEGFLREKIFESLFLAPKVEEVESARAYFSQTKFLAEGNVGSGGRYYPFSLLTPDGLTGKAFAAINPEKLKIGKISWFLIGTPPGSFDPGVIDSQTPMTYVDFAHLEAPGIALGEPNQRGFDSSSPDFKDSGFESMHVKGLAAIGLLKLLVEGGLGVAVPAGRFLELAGYSGGANAALVIAANSSERLKRLLTFSSSYDMFEDQFKKLCLTGIGNGFSQGNVLFWAGGKFFSRAMEAAKSNDPAAREKFIEEDLSAMRKLMLRLSPYYWVDKIPPNSFVWEIAHGKNDKIAPFIQTEQLVKKLVRLGWDNDHLRVFVHNGDHFFVGQGEVIDPQSYWQK